MRSSVRVAIVANYRRPDPVRALTCTALPCRRDKVFIERSQVSGDEMLAEDGVVHVLDDVIMPDRGQCWARQSGDTAWSGEIWFDSRVMSGDCEMWSFIVVSNEFSVVTL